MEAKRYFSDLNQKVACHQNRTFQENANLTKKAYEIISNYTSISSILDAFVVFAALNYLNAKAKKDHEYSFKRKVESIIEIVSQKTNKINFYLEITKTTNTLYVSFFDFIFSFHKIQLSNTLANKLAKEQPISFDGLRKQFVADLILEDAIKAKNQSTGANIQQPNKFLTAKVVSTSQSNNVVDQNKTNSLSFSYREIGINEIENKFHISKLCTTKETATNICVVIANCYFLKDLIAQGNLSNVLHKSNLRLLVTQIDSVVEAIELELGAKYLNIIRQSTKHDIALNSKCLREFKKRIKLSDANTRNVYDNLHETRNCIHLSKYQPRIYENPYFTNDKVETYFAFLMQYIEFIYQNLFN